MPEVRSCFGTRHYCSPFHVLLSQPHCFVANDEVFLCVELGAPREVFAQDEVRVCVAIAQESYTPLERETEPVGAANRFTLTTRDAEEGEVGEKVETHHDARSRHEEDSRVANPRRRCKDIGGVANHHGVAVRLS